MVSGSGTLDLTAWSFVIGAQTSGRLVPNAFFVVGPAVSTLADLYNLPVSFSGPSSFGSSNSLFLASSGSGDVFGLDIVRAVGALFVPSGYTSGNPLSGSSTYSGVTFASLGVTPGTFVWSWGSGGSADSITLNIIPEPSTALLFATAAGFLSLALRRHRTA